MKKVLTIILDGYGIREEVHGNAIKMAKTPNFNMLWETFPHSLLEASGTSVGLMDGQFGNSEIGHQTIGGGLITKSKEVIINEMIENNEIENNSEFLSLINHVKTNNSSLHLIGLLSDGGVHSNISYIKKLIQLIKKQNINKLYFHVITDGRDTKINVSLNYINEIKKLFKELNFGEIASVCGRYYAMDRDKKYDRTKAYYDLITKGVGLNSESIEVTINKLYSEGIFDEFLPPINLTNQVISENDGVFWINFRQDRAIQILRALTYPNFDGFTRIDFKNVKLTTIFPVADNIVYNYLFDNMEANKNPLGVYLSTLGLRQARIAETEKRVHVTYFFDGGREEPVLNADYFIFESPKVSDYATTPDMRAIDIKNQTINCMKNNYDFILVNFCNSDMLGHTGNMEAAIKAVETVDKCLGEIYEAKEDYTIIILADHGNSDEMLDENDNIITTHSMSKVPFIITDKGVRVKTGGLSNVAPTILEYMNIEIPKEMKETTSLFEQGEK